MQKCYDRLIAMGFGGDLKGDVDGARLKSIAQAADGNLEEAIDMIDEERQAWEQCKLAGTKRGST